ncbi:bZIP transcription factor [Sphaerulina musiva SO2202]|uniref:BZIP transcription factor n=1 Tax=Sphaerulina musiva (strain SO2202) TaxID=692275 RepID=M3D9S6_SPHMS|nr:bZIP transcription factor [Sphaerulina musiva SO2202]EMF14629.1 bZIP transcription factor [Sphaerulina musiva SO2202]
MIVSRESATTVVVEPDFDENDVRTMSPRRNSEEVDKLSEEARKDLIEQAKLLQMSLQAIVDRVETVKSEHEKLEGGNKFLQSYIGELMQTSKITSTAPSKSKKGKARS